MKNPISLLVAQASESMKTAVSHIRIQAILYAIMGFAVFMLILFMCITFFILLSEHFSIMQVCLMIMAFWVLVLLFCWIMAHKGSYKEKASHKNKHMHLMSMPDKEQKKVLLQSAVSTFLWTKKNTKLVRYAVPFITITALTYFLKGVNHRSEHKN